MPDADRVALFRSWLAAHGPAVMRVARAYTRDPADAQDLAQDILLQVWRSLPSFGGRADPATWCYRVALNTALGWHRREARRRDRQRLLAPTVDPPDPADSTRAVERREAVERLYAAIRRLAPTDAALVLLHLDGLGYRQIAEVLGITTTNVGAKLTRARNALRTLLDEERP